MLYILFIIVGIYREAYLIRKPAQYIADFEFSSDITIPVDKEKKKKVKAYNALDDLIDNIDEGNDKDKEGKLKKVLTANVNISVLAGGVRNIMKSLHGEKEEKMNEKKESSSIKGGEKKEKGGKEEMLSYAVRAEMFENGAFGNGPVLTLFSQLEKVHGDIKCADVSITNDNLSSHFHFPSCILHMHFFLQLFSPRISFS